MKVCGTTTGILFLSACCWLLPAARHSLAAQDLPGSTVPYYDMGRERMNRGEWEVALKVWAQGIQSLQNRGITDPRLGFAFISAATKNRATDYYRDADIAYFWALKKEAFTGNMAVFRKEVERLSPLMEGQVQQTIERKLRTQDASLVEDIRRFWDKADPILTTDLNERLIEHWERIAHAKNTFTREDNTVYGTDDRGLIYIKYGSPASTHSGTLTFDNALLRSKASELIEIMNPTSGFRTDSAASTLGSSRNARLNNDLMVENLVRRVREFYRNSYYEVWIYPPGEEEVDNTIFIFGQDGDTGVFGLRKSVEEMIPRGAFGLRGDQARISGVAVSPGLLLQLMAYSELSSYDPYFLDNLLDMESEIFSIHRNNTVYIDEVVKSRNEFRMQRLQAKLPPEHSTLVDEKPQIDIDYRYYRMLRENNPVLLVSMFSDPHEALMLNWAHKINEQRSYDFNLMHSVKLISGRRDQPIVQTDTARLYVLPANGRNDSTIRVASQSIFLLPNIAGAENILSAELQDNADEHESAPEGLRTDKKLLGLGLTDFYHPEPLSTSGETLVMSDLILGYSKSPEDHYFLPFLLAPENRIPAGENLVVRFEVYHLTPGPDGQSAFTVDYSIRPRKRGLRRLLGIGREEQVSLTLNFNTASKSFHENLEIETGDLEPGTYRLRLTSTGLETGRSVERSVEFEIQE